MKRIIAIVFGVLFAANSIKAQTISIAPITKLEYCVGEILTVSYAASGSFNTGNTFILQLSDGSGSFSTFTNAGSSSKDSALLQVQLSNAGTYRVRVVSTDPYIISDENPDNIVVPGNPTPSPSLARWGGARYTYDQCSCHFAGGLVGDPIVIKDYSEEPSGSAYLWTFNEDATPQTSIGPTATVTYPTSGIKDGTLSVTNAGGCDSVVASFSFQVLSCDPVIPSNVHIVTDNETGTDPVAWVKAGGTYTAVGDSQTVFADPGSSVIVGGSLPNVNYSTYYLKTGSSFSFNSSFAYAAVILSTGNEINIGDKGDTLYCGDLTFEQQGAGVTEDAAPEIIVQQAFDFLMVSGGSLITVRILNILGAEVLSRNGTGELDVDLAPLPAGVYFAVVQSGDVREVRKIAVVH